MVEVRVKDPPASSARALKHGEKKSIWTFSVDCGLLEIWNANPLLFEQGERFVVDIGQQN